MRRAAISETRAGVVHQHQKYAVTQPYLGRSIWRIEQALHLFPRQVFHDRTLEPFYRNCQQSLRHGQ